MPRFHRVASWPIFWATLVFRLPLAALAMSFAAVAAIATAGEYVVSRWALAPLNDLHRTPGYKQQEFTLLRLNTEVSSQCPARHEVTQ